MSAPVRAVHEKFAAVRGEIARVLVGQDAAVESVCACVLVGGHVLLEGFPGTAKTLLARALAAATRTRFARIQFTPDLMPADITGTTVFEPAARVFEFRPGPIFTDLLLADEVNRAPAKTQAALLEAMHERQVTADGRAHPLPPLFTVLATQNPIEYEGTYPLPEAQLDRFMVKLRIAYPEAEHEQEILKRYRDGRMLHDVEAQQLTPQTDAQALLELRAAVTQVRVEDSLLGYVNSIVRATRSWPSVSVGASPRAGISLLLLSKGLSAVRGREYVTPDDVKSAAPDVLRHRILLKAEAEIEGVSADDVVRDLLATVPVPR